ncbi:Acyl-CoA dehydrogenase [Variovorax sp. OK605]|uniref:acyl-CoA dehydrogenase family protein n=1 Tax=unclassified Variovorax TaxID=663243 RepID=UPI0008BA39EE|nr:MULTISPECIES: acyl-CoA dehydrogenase family protein [unclassified Variovorax]SEK08539.1 Acyl-CoA dehydrogenase [Variovorax sp. OK202]SFD56813.1 Acyl-CoA dehydrogenase [Variovorax sp. OK212]SFP85932.1 Acyl-CoA dehydrogenase [Variovorax sp. OK605]
MSFTPLFPGMLLDAAARFAQDNENTKDFAGTDPVREMGWTCTLVPEAAGGVGGTLGDLASIVVGLAAHGVHLPVVETCAVAPLLLQAAGADISARWLEAVCEGSAKIAPLTALSASLDDIAVTAKQLDIGYAFTGEVKGVDVSLAATHYIVPAVLQGSDETALFLVDLEHMPAPAATYRTMEGRRSADFRLDGVTVPAVACIARGAAADAAIEQADNAALLLTAADTVAALTTLIEQTVKHLQERRQFGVALASFQVLRHRTADMYVRYLCAKGLMLHAFQEHERGAANLRRTLRLMKVALAETARLCAEGAIQMHGGMGVSEEVLATRMAQRLLASEFRYGDRMTHASRLLYSPAEAAVAQATAGGMSPVSRSSS